MPNIIKGHSYYYIDSQQLQALISLGYTNAASEFIYTNPADSTYLYAEVSSVDTQAELDALLRYWYPDEDEPSFLEAPVFDYMQSGQIPYPFWQ